LKTGQLVFIIFLEERNELITLQMSAKLNTVFILATIKE